MNKLPRSLTITSTALCAALYAVCSFATAYIQSPWGMGQFRPAVIVPAFFAIVFGPWVGGIGAAVGTLICDSIKHGTLYMGSLIAAVPGNFVGFYLLGYVAKKRFTWSRFILASNITLIVGNFIVAFLYIFAYKLLYAQALKMPVEALVALSIGLTLFWFITMLPFMLIITPLLIKAAAVAFPTIVSEDIRVCSLKKEIPKRAFSLSLIVPGIVMLLLGVATTSSPLGYYLTSEFAKIFTSKIMELLQLLFYGSGVTLLIMGFAVLSKSVFRK